MKKRFLLPVGALFVVGLLSCSGGAGKFVGRWRPVNEGRNVDTIVIKKNGEKYDLYPANDPSSFYSLEYDDAHDLLTVSQRGETMDITYDKASKHIAMRERGGRTMGELENVD